MILRHDLLRQHIAHKVSVLLAKKSEELGQWEHVYDQLVLPPNPEMGDLALGCFRWAKSLKKAPPVLAQELAGQLSTDEVIESVSASGPYLNLRFSSSALGRYVGDPSRKGDLFKVTLSQSEPRTMIEYSQPNTHKELHVGHMRNLCLGNAIVRMQKYLGVDVVSATFPGDMGTHVAKCLWYMKKHNQESVPATNRGEWLGQMYSKGHIKLEDDAGTEREEQNKEELTQIIQQLEQQNGEYFDLWKETRSWSIELMENVYRWADVSFDVWYWESQVDAASVAWVKSLLDEGKLVVSDGAVGMDLNDEGLGFCLLLKRDGTGLYATKDLELARRKFDEHKIEKSIYVVDMRQALHFRQVFTVLKRLGFPQAEKSFHLQYNFVELPDGAMSSRKGNIVPILDLIHQMEELVKTQYLNRYQDAWPQDELNKVANFVAQGAIKYGMLKMDNNKKIVFDMAEWLKLEGESGPFIQYSYARIASLDRKLGYDPKASVDWSLLTHSAERRLLQLMMNFNTVVAQAALDFKPSSVCGYLYDLAKLFNVFYHECPIGSAETPELKNARLALSASTGAILKQGLALLGIPVPERM